ncbi:hypothetical protein ACMFMG_009616 [Clarireedia jacksonii]
MKLKWSKKYPTWPQNRLAIFAGLASSTSYFNVESIGPKDAVLLGVVFDPRDDDKYLSFQYSTQYFHVQPNHGERASKPHWVNYRVSWDVIRKWLRNCDDTHLKDCHKPPNSSIADLQVIDCRSRRVTTLPTPSTPYITLSYLWGQGKDMIGATDILPAGMPQVIEDALIVARELKFEYLWVDRYCIPQQDSSLRNKMIKNMGNIYECSALTLVAATGEGPEYGMSGVSSDGANFQGLNLGPVILTMTDLGEPEQIRSSKWFTRGWTYQEDTLLCAPEDSFKHIFPRVGVGPGIHSIDDRIREYCTRSLTHDEDIIDAFRGILTKFESMSPKLKIIWGLPLYDPSDSSNHIIDTRILAIALLWESSRPAERRLTAPSWTWAGWKFPSPTSGDRSFALSLSWYMGNPVISADILFQFSDDWTRRWDDSSSMRLRLRESEEQHSPPSLIIRAFCFDIEWSAKAGNNARIICQVASAQFEFEALLRLHITAESDRLCCKAVLIDEDLGAPPWPAILLVRQVRGQTHYERVGTARAIMYIDKAIFIEIVDLKQKTQGRIEEILVS